MCESVVHITKEEYGELLDLRRKKNEVKLTFVYPKCENNMVKEMQYSINDWKCWVHLVEKLQSCAKTFRKEKKERKKEIEFLRRMSVWEFLKWRKL